jgi:hypothetical protein
LRTTLTYRIVPRFSFGIEYNPLEDEVVPLANLVAVTERVSRPAVIFGTSSDRIGTPEGQAYFVTVSKDLESVNGWKAAPYVGAAYGTFDDELRAVGGIRWRLPLEFTVGGIYDGEQLHLIGEYRFRKHVFSVLWVELEDLGVAYSIAF